MQGYYKTHCQPPFKKFTLKIQLKKKKNNILKCGSGRKKGYTKEGKQTEGTK